MNEEDLRDCFAMMITVGMCIANEDIRPKAIWEMADLIVEARNQKEPEVGIVAAKSRRKVKDA